MKEAEKEGGVNPLQSKEIENLKNEVWNLSMKQK